MGAVRRSAATGRLAGRAGAGRHGAREVSDLGRVRCTRLATVTTHSGVDAVRPCS